MKIEIAVTREDIDKGVPTDSEKCPVARAAIRAVKPYSRIKVSSASQEGISFSYKPPVGYEGECYADANTPKAVAKFMNKFDEFREPEDEKAARAKLKPFAVVVKLPDAWFKSPEKKVSKKAKPAKKKSKK